jgi:molybdopterin-guanine dinucleotide biosynthesis protein A
MNENVAGIILAGGLSRRMGGGDKGLLELAGRPVLAHVVSRLAPQVASLALNANGDASRFKDLDLPVVADTVEGFAGPLAGILAGLEWAANTRSRAVVTVAGDTPFFPLDLVERLAASVAADPAAIAVACSNGRRHPVFALWPLTLRPALAGALAVGERKVSAFIDSQAFVDVDFPSKMPVYGAFDPFFNINTPQDLAEAGRILGGETP